MNAIITIESLMDNVDAIIFDFDGTMYDISDVRKMVYDNEINYLIEYRGMKKEEASEFLKANKILDTCEPKSATECFRSHGFDMMLWNKYRTEHFIVSCIDKAKAVKEETIVQFKRYGYVFLVSSNTHINIINALKQIGISAQLFDEIISTSKEQFGTYRKSDVFIQISMKYGINLQRMLSIGDRFCSDIEPMIQLGGQGILVEGPRSLERMIECKKEDIRRNNSMHYFCSSDLVN